MLSFKLKRKAGVLKFLQFEEIFEKLFFHEGLVWTGRYMFLYLSHTSKWGDW